MKSALIYVLDVPYYADKAYSYYVPDTLGEAVTAGVLVEVPFGGGNRHMTGIVFECRFDAPEDIPMKPVASVLGDGALLSEEMLGLCRFIKEYTLCTFGDAVRATVPSAAMSKVVHSYKIIPKKERDSEFPLDYALEQLGERGRRVYDALQKHPRFTRQTLNAEFDFDCTRVIAQMLKYGLCERYSEIKDSAGVKYIRRLSLSDSLVAEKNREGADSYFVGLAEKLRGANQKKLFEVIAASSTGGIEENAAYTSAGLTQTAGRAAASSLETKNYIKIEKEDFFRNSFTAEAYAFAHSGDGSRPTLSPHQAEACEKILDLYERGLPAAALLHGVTGSGKTNVLLAAMDRVLADGRGVIMLVPEIALTPQTVGIFMARYGDNVAVLHSALPSGERYDAWRRIKRGEVSVVVGTRSAIFAPLPNIGMIVIDEEHEYTYKSETNPKYHAHDIARYRCRDHNAILVLSSATPSVTSYYKAKKGIYTLVELNERYGNARLPDVQIYDMRRETANGNISPIGELLAARLLRDKAEGNQSVLFLNRRGYNNYVSCRSCGNGLKCTHCSVTLTYHAYGVRDLFESENSASDEYLEERRKNGYLVCHLCGSRTRVPDKCPDCGSTHFLFMGCGTQKAEDEICASLPGLRVLRMDHDTTQAKSSVEDILSKFRAGEADVLLGTQMVTKGHDFPRVATVGVLNSDSALLADDYRASERTFAMLTQVIGRAGRANVPGTAIIQTYNPDHEVLRYAAAQDYRGFFAGEIRLRQSLTLPPFCDIAVITLSSANEAYLGLVTARMYERMLETLRIEFRDIPLVLYGPFEAPVYRVQNMCRMRFVIKCRLNRKTRDFISGLVCEFGRFTPKADAKKNERTAGTSSKERTSAAVTGAKSDRRLTISVDLNPSTV